MINRNSKYLKHFTFSSYSALFEVLFCGITVLFFEYSTRMLVQIVKLFLFLFIKKKLWSCFPMKDSEGDLTNNEIFTQRKKYTYEQYLRLTADPERLHDFDEESPAEDPRMIALFDSLIERTQNDWASDSGSDSEVSSRDTRVDRILSLLFDNYVSSTSASENEEEVEDNDETGAQGETDGEPSGTFGVSISELQRIFRRNREIVETELPNEDSSPIIHDDESDSSNSSRTSNFENPQQDTSCSKETVELQTNTLASGQSEETVDSTSISTNNNKGTSPETINSETEEEDSATSAATSDCVDDGESSTSRTSNNAIKFKKRKPSTDRQYRK